jgi:hypothetical protein
MSRSYILVLAGLLAMPPLLFAQHETITIKNHAKNTKASAVNRSVFYGELDGKPVMLQCALSHDDCKDLPKGEYVIVRLLEGEGAYKNCPNVDIYQLDADLSREEPLGEYCLHDLPQ